MEGEKLWSDKDQAWLAAVSVRDMHRVRDRHGRVIEALPTARKLYGCALL